MSNFQTVSWVESAVFSNLSLVTELLELYWCSLVWSGCSVDGLRIIEDIIFGHKEKGVQEIGFTQNDCHNKKEWYFQKSHNSAARNVNSFNTFDFVPYALATLLFVAIFKFGRFSMGCFYCRTGRNFISIYQQQFCPKFAIKLWFPTFKRILWIYSPFVIHTTY